MPDRIGNELRRQIPFDRTLGNSELGGRQSSTSVRLADEIDHQRVRNQIQQQK